MNDDETTILDPQYTGNPMSNNSTSANPQTENPTQAQPQAPKKDKMEWGEKAAYAAGGAVFGAGMTLAGQAMAANSNEVPTPTPEDLEEKDKEPTDATTTEPTPETKVTVDEVSGVTVETAGTTVHVNGHADVDINNGNIHVSTATADNPDSATVGQGASNTNANTNSPSQHQTTHDPQPHETQSYHRTNLQQESYNPQGPAPDPEDAIVATATGVRVAQVDDNASFSQAFADARAQVGPGGIFEWHGRVYATYYKEEWDSMSAAERHNFQANIDYTDVVTDESIAQHHNEMAHHNTHPQHHDTYQEPQHYNEEEPQYIDDGYQQVAEDEVRVLQVGETDLNEDGIPEDAVLIEENGLPILIVDIDRDGIGDLAFADVDGDGEPEYGDISDQHYQMPTMTDGDMYLANNDCPDYMNDADVDNYMA